MKRKTLKRRKEAVAVIGVGYVGLPLACLCAEKGYKTYGIGKDRKKLNLINKGVSPIHDQELSEWLKRVKIEATTDYRVLRKADIICVCVPTPVDALYHPDLRPVISATEGIRKNLRKGQLIIMESTVNPGVCEEVMVPILEKSGLKAGKDFDLAHCPERINPGDKKWNVRNIPRVVGAYNERGLKRALKFYRTIIEAEILPMKSLKEAEATKIVENSFRDINIAFVNELAKSFDTLGIDVVDVIKGASTKPFAFMAHWPSSGVGGHCIPVDPYYLIEKARERGFNHAFLKLAREINNSMPQYTVDQLIDSLNAIKRPARGTAVGLLGLSYKANIADLRESPSLKIIKLLKGLGVSLHIYDPFVPNLSNVQSLESLLKKSEAIVLATDHDEFKKITPKILKKYKIRVVVDGKNCLDKSGIQKLGIVYKGIGR